MKMIFYSVFDEDGNIIGLFRDEDESIRKMEENEEWTKENIEVTFRHIWTSTQAFVTGKLWGLVLTDPDGTQPIWSLHDTETEAQEALKNYNEKYCTDDVEINDLEIQEIPFL